MLTPEMAQAIIAAAGLVFTYVMKMRYEVKMLIRPGEFTLSVRSRQPRI